MYVHGQGERSVNSNNVAYAGSSTSGAGHWVIDTAALTAMMLAGAALFAL